MKVPLHHRLAPRAGTWPLALAAITLALAGCGGGSGDDTATRLEADSLDAAIAAAAPGTREWLCAQRVNDTPNKLNMCITAQGVRRHLDAFQRIANENGGQRASGTSGYDRSVEYAERVFRDAGYVVSRQAFDFRVFRELSPSVLTQTAPAPGGAIAHRIMAYSGSGDVTAAVQRPSGALTGCDPADFAGFGAGRIALIRRGSCTFVQKATNAHAAGARGVVIYNNVDAELNGTLGEDFALNIPVVAVTLSVGEQLAATPGLELRIKTDTRVDTVNTYNVIAESRYGDPNNVVMIGAHLDSVDEGPGINDNGTGSAAVLETAVQLGKVRPRNKLRFALWGAEESGLVGSTHYVQTLSEEERSRIALYLNFDMVGSPNFVYFVYDGGDSDGVGAGPGPAGSAQIEKLFESFFAGRGLATKGTDFDGRSDYGPFIEAGIPAGGLFTGAEGIKSAEEAAKWGGIAGQPYDPCYHRACDTLSNVNPVALQVNAQAIGYATLYYAMNTADVAGMRAQGQFEGKASVMKSVVRLPYKGNLLQR